MNPQEFWNSTMYEICVYMDAIRNKDECKLKDLHYLASLFRVAIVAAFDKDGRVKVPTFEEVMSGNIDEPKKSNVYHGWEESKAYMKAIQEVRTNESNN